jgi:hypothetical protein
VVDRVPSSFGSARAAQFDRIARSGVLASAILLFVGCATPQNELKPSGYYITNQFVYGCDSFEGKKGTVTKKTALLSLGLQRRLLGLLDQAASADKDLLEELDNYRDALMCWYETPEKEILLRLGPHCDDPFEIYFRPRGEGWVLSFASRAIVMCHSARR